VRLPPSLPSHQLRSHLLGQDWNLDLKHMPLHKCCKYLLIMTDTFIRWSPSSLHLKGFQKFPRFYCTLLFLDLGFLFRECQWTNLACGPNFGDYLLTVLFLATSIHWKNNIFKINFKKGPFLSQKTTVKLFLEPHLFPLAFL
jgi:hypothetical protein